MSLNVFPYGFKSLGYKTESSGTAIEQALWGNGGRVAVAFLSYTGSGTAHTLSFMYADGTGSRNKADGEAASGQADITVVDTPQDPAGNGAAADDVVAYQKKNGDWAFSTISSVSSNTITLNDNVEAPGIADGGKVNISGAQGDGAEMQLLANASSAKEWEFPSILAPYFGEPLWFYSPNGTNAGSIDTLVLALLNK